MTQQANKTGKDAYPHLSRMGMGRPKGSKNKISLLKMVAEQAVLENNFEKMQGVCNKIIDNALKGDKASQKLVWNSMMSNGFIESKAASDRVEITINTIPIKEATRVAPVTINQTEDDTEETTNER